MGARRKEGRAAADVALGPKLTVDDLCQRWRCSPWTVYRQVERGLPCTRLPGGRRLLFDVADVTSFEGEGRVEVRGGARGG
jgi:hypothetical protein